MLSIEELILFSRSLSSSPFPCQRGRVIRQSQGERKRRFFISPMGIICLRRSAWPALPQRA